MKQGKYYECIKGLKDFTEGQLYFSPKDNFLNSDSDTVYDCSKHEGNFKLFDSKININFNYDTI